MYPDGSSWQRAREVIYVTISRLSPGKTLTDHVESDAADFRRGPRPWPSGKSRPSPWPPGSAPRSGSSLATSMATSNASPMSGARIRWRPSFSAVGARGIRPERGAFQGDGFQGFPAERHIRREGLRAASGRLSGFPSGRRTAWTGTDRAPFGRVFLLDPVRAGDIRLLPIRPDVPVGVPGDVENHHAQGRVTGIRHAGLPGGPAARRRRGGRPGPPPSICETGPCSRRPRRNSWTGTPSRRFSASTSRRYLDDPQALHSGEGREDLDWKGRRLATDWTRLRFGAAGAQTTVTMWFCDEVPGGLFRFIKEAAGPPAFREELVVEDVKAVRADPASIERLSAGREPVTVEVPAISYVLKRFASIIAAHGDGYG
ncbi:MAG: hypothetical protein MZV70_70795 [Desulfobacterales bacterium]|nr:hypothetical protein [Desulfobacterales bacterium]